MLSSFNELLDPLQFGKHKSCYNSYTNPRNLDKFPAIEKEKVNEEEKAREVQFQIQVSFIIIFVSPL